MQNYEVCQSKSLAPEFLKRNFVLPDLATNLIKEDRATVLARFAIDAGGRESPGLLGDLF